MSRYARVMDHTNKFSATQQQENAGASMAMEEKNKKPEKLESQVVIPKVSRSYLELVLGSPDQISFVQVAIVLKYTMIHLALLEYQK